ncbi:MAG: DUF58 domain-containing protein [Anaerolineales bacterium]|nr:DUF58 domain-containing protein [Anaerolineales bacterium]MCO5245128.1 DUF58 domain-containing protein [Anaerolineae bacterium]
MRDFLYLLIALLALALLLRLNFVYYIVYVVGGIWLLARWATPRSLAALRVRRQFVDHAFLGERIPVVLEVSNPSWFPIPWLRLTETMPLDLAASEQFNRVYSLRPREKVTIDYELHCTRRGYYPLGPLRLVVGDLFGFSDADGRDGAQQFLTVYPRIIPLVRLGLPSRLPHGTLPASRRIFEDPARLRGVREYQPGDNLRRIHWKASAHSDALLVKQFSPAISLESMVLLNLNTQDYHRQRIYSASEWAIVVAASVATYLESMRQAVGLATNGRDPLIADNSQQLTLIPPRPGRLHLMKQLEVLARVEVAESAQPFMDWAQRSAVSLAWGTTVLAITPLADEAVCQGFHRLTRAGMNVVLLVTEPYANFGVVRERARRLGLRAYQTATEDDLTRLQTTPSGAVGVAA